MKRVLLLSLSNSGQKVCDQRINEFRSRQRLWNTPNLSLLTVGAMLPKDWEIHYVDLAYESVQEWAYDMVFMSPSTTQSQAVSYTHLISSIAVAVHPNGRIYVSENRKLYQFDPRSKSLSLLLDASAWKRFSYPKLCHIGSLCIQKDVYKRQILHQFATYSGADRHPRENVPFPIPRGGQGIAT